MLLKDFLDQYVEGYLFHDLDSMDKITLQAGQTHGAAGYPMLISILAGMELLGYLLMPDDEVFSDKKGDAYFENYWDNYLVQEEPLYTDLGKLFRNLVRHGIAHTFLTKIGILVTKGSGKKIVVDSQAGELLVDASVLMKEFIDSYNHYVQPVATGNLKGKTNAARMQEKLNSMIGHYEVQSKSFFGKLQGGKQTAPAVAAPQASRAVLNASTSPIASSIAVSGLASLPTQTINPAPDWTRLEK